MRLSALAFVLPVVALGCASTVDGTAGRGPDAGAWTDVLPGLNPDGLDPFRPVEAGVISVDASAGDAGEPTFADATVFDQRSGSLYIGSNSSGVIDTTYVSASFRYVPFPDDPRCGQRSAGSWDFTVCSSAGVGPADPHPRVFPNAGTIAVAGGVDPVTLRLQTNGQYNPYYEQDVNFPGPAVVRVSAPGTRDVPAFSLSFDVPPTVVVTTPASGDEIVVDRGRDLVVEWTPNAAREVWVVLSAVVASDGDSRSYRVAAQTYGDVGRAVIPARALAELPVIADGRAALTVLPFNITTARIGSWPVTATVVGQGRRYTATVR